MGAGRILTWPELDAKIAAWERDNPTLRITRITSSAPEAPPYWRSLSNECEVGHGAPGIRLSSGEIIEF